MRILIAVIALILAAASYAVFDAASATAQAVDRTEKAAAAASPESRANLLAQARAILDADPLGRSGWHSGAVEAAAWGAMLAANQPQAFETAPARAAHLQNAKNASLAAIRAAPIAPAAWVRLARLEELGVPNPLCNAAACLQQSYRAAPIGERRIACARVAIAIQAGLITAPEDPRVDALTTAGVHPTEIEKCLPTDNPNFLFRAYLRAQRLYKKRKHNHTHRRRSSHLMLQERL